MKAVAYRQSLPIDQPESLEDLELPAPTAKPRDLVVRVGAVSVNPVDTKIRRGSPPAAGEARVLGWDAVGIVESVGADVSGFAPGERVYYAGALGRPGANSELHAVDERLVGRAPTSLDDAHAAALPLTAITAHELLFERLQVPRDGGDGQTLLVVGGAGGVGSILIQLAHRMTRLHVVATASRPQTRDWCRALGAHAVIDHAKPFADELRSAGVGPVDMVACLTRTEQHYTQIVDCLRPQGKLGVIDDMKGLDAMKLKGKSISLHWELMFTRSTFETPDMGEQGRLLGEVAGLVDSGVLVSTASTFFDGIHAANLRRAHALVESGRAIGKVVLRAANKTVSVSGCK